ncbi:hypothetical protein EDB83DRAFT_2675329 [Lactarius deliciosus]|nr:hypothetical protein EDB83DRAFT_2675329 [Lactarius deliciosus]
MDAGQRAEAVHYLLIVVAPIAFGVDARPLPNVLSLTPSSHGKKQLAAIQSSLKPCNPLNKSQKTNPSLHRVHLGNSRKSPRRRSSPLRDPPHEDAMMAPEPTPSSLAHLAVSAATHGIKELQQQRCIHTLHKTTNEADVMLLVFDTRDPGIAVGLSEEG